MQTVAQFIVWLSGRLNALALWGAVAAVSVMVMSIMYQVVSRYIFASPPIWTEELARYAMVWAGLLGASCAFHASTDPTLFPAANLLRGSKGLIAAIGRFCAVATFAMPVLWFCFIGPNGGFTRGFYRTLNGAQRRDVRVFNGLDQPCDPHWSGFGSGACFCGYRGTSTPSKPKTIEVISTTRLRIVSP